MALSLLFLGCERDEVQEHNSSPTLTQQEAMNLFFKTYQRKKDNFCDGAVNSLLAMNDSTGVIVELTNKYGQPLWNIGQTKTSKSATYMAIPVCVPGKDSVSSVFVFLEQDSSLHLKIFEANNPDTLLSDFVLHYQCSLFPGKRYSRITFPVEEGRKDYTLVTTCWISATTTDWVHFNVTKVSCTEKVVYQPTLDIGMGDGGGSSGNNSDGGGSGGGGNGGTSTDTSSPNTTTLSDPAKNNLKNAETKLKNGPCLSKTVMDNTWNNSLTITINGGITDIARYNSLTGKLEFRDVGSITDRVMLHELLHAYQAKLYGKDYEHTRTHEFEAWLLVDLYLFSQNMDKNNLTWTKNLSDDIRKNYYTWVKSIYEDGFTTGLGGNSNMCTFWRDAFITAVPKYKDLPKGTSTFPSTIDNLIKQCK